MSSLVICSMLAYSLAAFSLDTLPWEDAADETETEQANFQDPNEDVIAEQQTEVAQNPADMEEALLLANLLGNSGRLQEAIPWYERVLEQQPNDVVARLDFARALGDGGFTADAELQFQRALTVDPRSQEGHFYLAEMYKNATPSRLADAAREYGEAKALDPDSFIGQQANQALLAMGVGQRSATPSPAASPEVDGAP